MSPLCSLEPHAVGRTTRQEAQLLPGSESFSHWASSGAILYCWGGDMDSSLRFCRRRPPGDSFTTQEYPSALTHQFRWPVAGEDTEEEVEEAGPVWKENACTQRWRPGKPLTCHSHRTWPGTSSNAAACLSCPLCTSALYSLLEKHCVVMCLRATEAVAPPSRFAVSTPVQVMEQNWRRGGLPLSPSHSNDHSVRTHSVSNIVLDTGQH